MIASKGHKNKSEEVKVPAFPTYPCSRKREAMMNKTGKVHEDDV